MADLRISELAALVGANLAADDLLPIVDISASETKKITVTDLVGNATTLIADATIPGAKILFSAGQVPGSAIAAGGVNVTQLADDAVTAAKLGNESTVDLVTTLPASGAFIGQLALDTDDLKVYCWNGSTWQSIKAAGSVNSVVGGSTGIVNITVTTAGDEVTINTTLDNTSAAAQFLAGPTAAAGAATYRTIAAGDLPTSTTSAKGAVQVNGNGLVMSGDTLQIDNTVTANSSAYHVVQYTSKGLVSDGRTIQPGDLPLAGAAAVGVVYPGSGLVVAVDGQLNHSNTVSPGTYPKVTYNAQGHVTAGSALVAADIPEISTDKLTSGLLPTERIANDAVTGAKLADSSTAQFGANQPIAEYTGQLYFNSLTRDIYIWDGNVWQPIGISVGEIVFAGTYNANTNLIDSVTSEGTAVGLVLGQVLPAASSANNRYYLVVSEGGTGVSPAPTVALSPPDIILSNGSAWTEIDVSQTVTSQVASSVVVVPAGGIGSNTVQAALEELDVEKLPKAGGTVTGELLIGSTGSLAFEGVSDNAYETTLGVVDPTADRSVLLPNVSGTVITTGDTGTVTSTMIADGTIVNADINASAAIVDTKLATISTTGKVANSATTATSDNTASAIVARDASGNFTAGTMTGSVTGAASLNVLKAGDTMTGALGITPGTSAAPSAFFSGDPNTGLYSPGADQVAISTAGTGRVFVDASGNVGIGGAASANGLLRLNAASGTNSNFIFSENNTDRYLLGQVTGDNAFRVYDLVANTERLRVTSDGNVGIGTQGPGSALQVNGAGGIRINEDGAGTKLVQLRSDYAGQGPAVNVFTNDPLLFLTNNSERLRITSDGKVGIGTSSPNRLLEVSAGSDNFIRVNVTSGAYKSGIEFAQGSTVYSQLYFNNVAPYDLSLLQQYSTGSLILGTNNTERLRITSDGKVGIGSTSDPVGSGSKLWVDHTADTGITINTTGSTSRTQVVFRNSNVNGEARIYNLTGGPLTIYKNSSEEAVRITSDGKVGVGTDSPSALLSVNATVASYVVPAFNVGEPSLANGRQLYAGYNTTDGTGFIQAVHWGTEFKPLILNPNGGKVGIGTSSPGFPFQVKSTTNAHVAIWDNGGIPQVVGVNDAGGSSQLRLAGQILSFTGNGGAGSEHMRLDASGQLGIGTSSPLTKLDVRGGVITAGSISSPNGSEILRGYYSTTDGALAVIGTEYSSGGIVIGSAVKPSTSASDAFLSSASVNVARGAYTIAGNTHKWYIGAEQTVAENGSVSTSEVMRIDSSGRLLVGTSTRTSTANVGVTQNIQVQGSSSLASVTVIGNAASSIGGYLTLAKSRSTTAGGFTLVSQGDELGAISFEGADGSAYRVGASIGCVVDGTPGANDMPGRLVFSTTADGASSPTERMRVSANGVVTVKNGAVAEIGTLTDAATITPDFAAACNFTVTLGGNRTLANPTNLTAGQSGSIFVVQDGTGSRTLAFGSYWDFTGGTAPTLTTAASAVDRIDYIVRSATSIHAVFTSNYS